MGCSATDPLACPASCAHSKHKRCCCVRRELGHSSALLCLLLFVCLLPPESVPHTTLSTYDIKWGVVWLGLSLPLSL